MLPRRFLKVECMTLCKNSFYTKIRAQHMRVVVSSNDLSNRTTWDSKYQDEDWLTWLLRLKENTNEKIWFFTSREAAWSCRPAPFLLLLLCLARRLVKKEGTFAFSDNVASVFGDFQWFQLFSIMPINFSLFPLMFHYFYCFCIKMFLTILNNFNFFLIS